MSGRWFRFYDAALDDPKVQQLPPKVFKAWVNLLCVASRNNGEIPAVEVIAFALRISSAEAGDTFSHLFNVGLLDRDNDGRVTPHNWSVRQYKSDTSADRMRRHRERNRDVTSSDTVTRSESETEADTEQTVAKATETRTRKEPPDDGKFRLPPDWQPSQSSRDHASDKGLDPENVTESFVDWFTNGRGKRERRDGPGWEKRYRIWCNTDAERKPSPRVGIRPASTGGDAGAFARAAARLGRD